MRDRVRAPQIIDHESASPARGRSSRPSDPSEGHRGAPRRERRCCGCGAGASLESVRSSNGRLSDERAEPQEARIDGDDAQVAETSDAGKARGSSPVLVKLVGFRMGDAVEIAVDTGDSAHGVSAGRGVYVHATRSCVDAAVRGGLAKTLRGRPSVDGAKVDGACLASLIGDAFERRMGALVLSAVRTRRVEIGTDAVVALLRNPGSRPIRLGLAAVDAASAVSSLEVTRAVSSGLMIAWRTKRELEALVRPGAKLPAFLERTSADGKEATLASATTSGVALVGITDDRIAHAAREAWGVVLAMRAPVGRPRSSASKGPSPSNGEGQSTGDAEATNAVSNGPSRRGKSALAMASKRALAPRSSANPKISFGREGDPSQKSPSDPTDDGNGAPKTTASILASGAATLPRAASPLGYGLGQPGRAPESPECSA